MRHKNQRVWLSVAIITILGLAVLGCPDEETTYNHVHQWGDWMVIKAANCIEEGEEKRICEKDTSHTETRVISVDSTAHDMRAVEGGIQTHPTCVTPGEGETACFRTCGTTNVPSGVIPPLGHDLVPTGNVLEEPTCEKEGVGEVECQREGCIHTEAQGVIPIVDHRWGSYTELTAPTCYQRGVNQRLCEECRIDDPTTIPGAAATGLHTMTLWIYADDDDRSTCQDEGTQERHCSFLQCQHKEFRTTPVDGTDAGHDWRYVGIPGGGQGVAPTCTERGSGVAICELCATSKSDGDGYDMDPNNHTALSTTFTPDPAPTCTTGGWGYKYCNDCEELDKYNADSREELAPLGHAFTGAWTTIAPLATCTARGAGETTCVRTDCDVKDTSPNHFDPLGHQFVTTNWVVSKLPTCTEPGDQTRLCTRDPSDCTVVDAVTGIDSLPALGPLHQFPATTAATCATDSVVFPCNRDVVKVIGASPVPCGFANSEVVVPAFNHTLAGGGTAWVYDAGGDAPTSCTVGGTGARTCSRCGTASNSGGSYPAEGHGNWVTFSATCVNASSKTCGRVWSSGTCATPDPTYTPTAIQAHNIVGWTTQSEPTCFAAGSEMGHCAYSVNPYNVACTADASVTTRPIPQRSHDMPSEWTPVTAPTCTTLGTSKQQCRHTNPVCSHEVTDNAVPMTSHDFAGGSYIETTAATCTVAKVDTKQCADCNALDDTDTETGSALGHDHSVYVGSGVSATCLVDGDPGTNRCVRYAVCNDAVSSSGTYTKLGHNWAVETWVTLTTANCENNGSEYTLCTHGVCDGTTATTDGTDEFSAGNRKVRTVAFDYDDGNGIHADGCEKTYKISYTGGNFVAERVYSKCDHGVELGTPGGVTDVQNAIGLVHSYAYAGPVSLELDNLDLGSDYISFTGWTRAITLSGSVTSVNLSSDIPTTGTIVVGSGVTITSSATIANTNPGVPADNGDPKETSVALLNLGGTVTLTGNVVAGEDQSAVLDPDEVTAYAIYSVGGTVDSSGATVDGVVYTAPSGRGVRR